MRGRVSRETEVSGVRCRREVEEDGELACCIGHRDDRKEVSSSGGCGWVTFTLPVHGDI